MAGPRGVRDGAPPIRAAVTADDRTGADDLGEPVLRAEDPVPAQDNLLRAARPQAQAALAGRIAAAGGRVLRWDRLVPR